MIAALLWTGLGGVLTGFVVGAEAVNRASQGRLDLKLLLSARYLIYGGAALLILTAILAWSRLLGRVIGLG